MTRPTSAGPDLAVTGSWVFKIDIARLQPRLEALECGWSDGCEQALTNRYRTFRTHCPFHRGELSLIFCRPDRTGPAEVMCSHGCSLEAILAWWAARHLTVAKGGIWWMEMRPGDSEIDWELEFDTAPGGRA